MSDSTSLQQSWTPLQLSVDQSYLGCPEYLLDVLRSFSVYRDILTSPEPIDEIVSDSYIQQAGSVLESTKEFDCYAWASSLPQSYSQDTQKLYTLAQSYKIGSLIYGRRVFDALANKTTSRDDLVRELIGTIDALKADEALFKCMLWPMFVAGLEAQEKTQRDFVIGSLDKFWFETKCVNVVNAGNILRKFWKQNCQTSWIFNIGQLERDWLLI